MQFRTLWGDIDVELYDEDKPITVRNFLRYVQSGRYTNMFFHRCPPNGLTGLTDFVVQGGGYVVVTNPAIARVASFGTIPNEFAVGRRFSNTYGTLAMAQAPGNTNSASSEWFFNLKNNSFLDNGYFTVFGRVIRGTNALNWYLGRSYGNGLQNLTNVLGPAFGEVPVKYSGTRLPNYNDLEYVQISVLSIKVTPAAKGTREISWNSLNTNRYRVEFTTNLPPAWNLLLATNGIGFSGQTMRVIDPTTNAPRRFYRVRLDL